MSSYQARVAKSMQKSLKSFNNYIDLLLLWHCVLIKNGLVMRVIVVTIGITMSRVSTSVCEAT